MEARVAESSLGWRLWALVPLLLLAVAVAFVVSQGDRVVDLVGGSPPPADEFDVRRAEFREGEIRLEVRNPQRDDLTIASVTVDDAIVPFTLDGPATLGRLRSSTIVVPFEWVEDDPIVIGVTSSTGIETAHEVAAARLTPQPSARGFLGYGLIGVLVGVVPVALGLLWLPSLRRARPEWVAAFMALTGGLLTFLGVEALFEAFELQAALPAAFGGPGLVLLGLAVSALGMTFVSSRLSRGRTGATGLALALLVAIGIGIHNLGEGLAIGSSFATGELQLGAFLVIGFMVHNVTEGLGIAAPASKERVTFRVARRAHPGRRRAGDPRHVDRRLRLERHSHPGLLRARSRRGAPGRGGGRPLRRAHGAGRASFRLGDRRLPRGDRRDVGHRAPHRIERLLVRPFLLAVLVAVLAVGCGPIPESSLPDLSAKDEIRVVTTVGMIADAVENVGGPRVVVEGLMGPGIDPHLYKASEGDVRRLERADVIFYGGLHLEAKMADVLERIGERRLTRAVTDGIDRSRLIAAGGGQYDPHVWFDAALWQGAVREVRDTLVAADPAHAEGYRTRAAAYLEQLDVLDGEARSRRAPVCLRQRG